MSGDRGACGACQADLTPENSSRLRTGKVVHVGCPGAVTENRFSVTSAEPTKTEVPASAPAEIAPNAQPRKGRRMSIGGGPPVVDFHVLGPRDVFAGVAEGARVAGEAWKSASAKMATAFEGVKFPTVRDLSDALQVPDETASAEPDDFEPPEHCSVCGKPKSKRLGLVLSTGTHLGCKAAQVRAQMGEEVAELKAEKEGLAEDLAEKEAEVTALEEEVEAVTEHPEIGETAQRLIDDLLDPSERGRRNSEQASLIEEPPKHGYGAGPNGTVLHVSPAREPGELIHLFGLQDRGAYPFGKDRPETITALCGQKTAAKTSDLEPTVARLDEPENVPKNANCLLCVRNWSPEKRVFPAYVKPSQWQDLKSATPQAEPYVSPVTRTGSRARSPRAGR